MICDFCSGVPAWRYPARDFDFAKWNVTSEGDWLACDECRELIQANRRTDLADRALAAIGRKHGLLVNATARNAVRTFHATFFESKLSEPVRLEQGS